MTFARRFRPVSAAPPSAERAPLAFAPGERITAFARGTLVWLVLAASARPYNGAIGAGNENGITRLTDFVAGDGYTCLIVVCASLGAAFFIREQQRATVRAVFPGFGGVPARPRRVVWLPNAVGALTLLAAALVSAFGGIIALVGASASREERPAFLAIPLLWAWQWFCFAPWSARWRGAL